MQRQSKGYTLFELIIVLSVAAILAVFIGVRLPSFNLYNQSSAAEEIRRDIRYTQTLAMSLGANYSIVFSASSYTITPAPPTGTYTVVMPSGITLSTDLTSGASANTITFNSLGTPSGATTVMIATSGSNTIQLTVAPETGYVNG